MLSILIFGFLIGMQHALEADHVAALTSLVNGQTAPRGILRHGASWGIGHALTLAVLAGAAVVTGTALSPTLSAWLEAVVGVMLIGLGGHVLWCLVRDRVHFHLHRHGADQIHLHAHSHAGEKHGSHGFDHRHEHPAGVPWRTFLVGMVHGLAGSAALIILTASTINDPWVGLGYVFLFGLGSVLGMVLLSALMAVPLAWTARTLTVTNNLLRGGIGLATTGLGVVVVWSSLSQL